MTQNIASQMKVYLKLVSLGQRQLLNKNSGSFFVITIQNCLRIPFKCSHILFGIVHVAYHIIRQTLVANGLNLSYAHVETGLLCC